MVLLDSEIGKCLSKLEMMGVACLDISKAFQSIDRSILFAKLAKMGIKKRILIIIMRLNLFAFGTVKINSTFSRLQMDINGVKTGSILGTLCFLV